MFPLYRGVYALAHANIQFKAWCLAAVKACGARRRALALGGRRAVGAARAHRPLPRRDRRRPIKRHDGINTFRADTIRRHHPQGHPGHDARADDDPPLLAGADSRRCAARSTRGSTSGCCHLRDLITHYHRGAKQLRAVLATAAPTRSENENAVLHLLHDAGIPKPLVNPAIEGTNLIPDFLWRDNALVLETDSWRYHDHLLARADDRTKQAILESLGYTVIRTSWAEITTRPDRMIARVSAGRAG